MRRLALQPRKDVHDGRYHNQQHPGELSNKFSTPDSARRPRAKRRPIHPAQHRHAGPCGCPRIGQRRQGLEPRRASPARRGCRGRQADRRPQRAARVRQNAGRPGRGAQARLLRAPVARHQRQRHWRVRRRRQPGGRCLRTRQARRARHGGDGQVRLQLRHRGNTASRPTLPSVRRRKPLPTPPCKA
jgi:hypothetical protein